MNREVKVASDLEVQEALLHLALIGHHFLIASPCGCTEL
jgi:hypothetical protein